MIFYSYILWVTLHAVARVRTKPDLQELIWESGWKTYVHHIDIYIYVDIKISERALILYNK